MSQRAVLLGLPRSGTTWMAQLIASHPSVHLVHEPDNRNLDVLGWLGTGLVGSIPSLVVGERAPDYRRMWRVAFAGGWPTSRFAGRATALLTRASLRSQLPLVCRRAALRGAAELAARQRPSSPVVLVKSVAAQLSLEWISAEFEPTVIVVWRHPLNMVASWMELGWSHAEFVAERSAIRRRFVDTPAWPPPVDAVSQIAWAACAGLTILLESAEQERRALVIHHEANSQDPVGVATRVLDHLGLEWHDAVAEAIAALNAPGEGFAPRRITSEEPGRWRSRIPEPDCRKIRDVIATFEAESETAARLWPSSPAVADHHSS